MKAEFKDRLLQAMEYNDMIQADLIKKTKIGKSTISYYMNGRSVPKNDNLYIIAKALNVSEGWLLGYDLPMERDMEQKTLDELAALTERIKKETEFRDLIIKINHLNSAQLDAIKNLLVSFPQQ